MRVSELCPSPHIEAAELGDNLGDSKVVTIRGVDIKEVGEEKAKKGVIYFEEFTRGMVVNRTNSQTIAGMYGGETDEWIGEKITLYRSETPYKGKIVPCIRVRDAVPSSQPAPPKKSRK